MADFYYREFKATSQIDSNLNTFDLTMRLSLYQRHFQQVQLNSLQNQQIAISINILHSRKKSNKMAQYGYQRDRFPSLNLDNFECIICSEVVKEPWECHSCGKMFCKLCITDWMTKNPQVKCPLKCSGSNIVPVVSKALLKLYNDLDIKCSNQKCNKVVKLMDLQKHESLCLKVKCWNHSNCQNIQDQTIKCIRPCCSPVCDTLLQLHQNFGNMKKMYQIVDSLFAKSSFKAQNTSSSPNVSRNIEDMAWDLMKLGTGIVATQGNKNIFLKEQSYVFRSAVGSLGFTSGLNYWEIIADAKTENQLKIGVSTSKDFDINSAFCDNPFGYAYYGLGQLRHNSNASGPSYGKRFKKQGILGCCLNMQKGTLSFALNGQYWGVAFTDPKLKQGTIYPAVSLLHCAGCKIRAGMPVPEYFKV